MVLDLGKGRGKRYEDLEKLHIGATSALFAGAFFSSHLLCRTHLFLLPLQFSHPDVPSLSTSCSLRSKSGLRLHKRGKIMYLNYCCIKQSEQKALSVLMVSWTCNFKKESLFCICPVWIVQITHPALQNRLFTYSNTAGYFVTTQNEPRIINK